MNIDMYIVLSSIALIAGALLEWRRMGVNKQIDELRRDNEDLRNRVTTLESRGEVARITAMEATIERLKRNL